MTDQGAYIVLGIFPFIAMLSTEPIKASWGYKHGRRGITPAPPLPPELKERSDRNFRHLRFVVFGVLGVSVCLLARWYSVPLADIGLHLRHWPVLVVVGVAAGMIYIGYLRVVRAGGSRLIGKAMPYRTPVYLTYGSPSLWVLINLVSCFAEELWRAFSIVSLEEAHHGSVFAIVASSVAFGLAHIENAGQGTLFEIGRFASHVFFGVLFGLLFILTGSIVPIYTGHLVANLAALYEARRTA